MFDGGLHSDVGSDQQLQSTDCWELLRDRTATIQSNCPFNINISDNNM